VAAFADKTATCYTLNELMERYMDPAVIAYGVFVAIFCACLYVGIKMIEKKQEDAEAGKSSSLSAFKKQWAGFHAFGYAALSGTLGAQNVLFAKSVGEMMKTSFQGDNQMTNPLTYLLIVCMLASIFTQTHFLAQGLARFDALYIVPVFQCFFIMVSIIGGGIFFSEFERLSALQAGFFALGVLITLFGVWKLSQREMVNLSPIDKFKKVKNVVHAVVRMQRVAKLAMLSPSKISEYKNAAAGGELVEHTAEAGKLKRDDGPRAEASPLAEESPCEPGIALQVKEDELSAEQISSSVVIGLGGGFTFFQVNPAAGGTPKSPGSAFGGPERTEVDLAPIDEDKSTVADGSVQHAAMDDTLDI